MSKNIYEIVPFAEVVVLVNRILIRQDKTMDEITKGITNAKCDWIPISDWEEFSDLELYQKLEDLRTPSGLIFVITEVSYQSKLGAFKVNAEDLRQFVQEHHVNFGECFFNGDVLLISEKQHSIWFFCHEGVYSLL